MTYLLHLSYLFSIDSTSHNIKNRYLTKRSNLLYLLLLLLLLFHSWNPIIRDVDKLNDFPSIWISVFDPWSHPKTTTHTPTVVVFPVTQYTTPKYIHPTYASGTVPHPSEFHQTYRNRRIHVLFCCWYWYSLLHNNTCRENVTFTIAVSLVVLAIVINGTIQDGWRGGGGFFSHFCGYGCWWSSRSNLLTFRIFFF